MKKRRVLIAVICILLLCIIIAGVSFLKPKSNNEKIESLEDLSGKTVAVNTGTIFAEYVEKVVPDTNFFYATSEPNAAMSVSTGKTDAWATDEPVARSALNEYGNLKIFTQISEDSYAFIFNKESEKAQRYLLQMNEYLAKIKADGTLSEIDRIWFGNDESKKTVDYPEEGPNGTVVFGTCTNVGIPFSYMKDGKAVGYDIDVVAHFCREYGYKLEIKDFDFSGMLTAAQTGKGIDFGGACITVTEERKTKMSFSEPNYSGGVVIVIRDEETADNTVSLKDFFTNLGDSFNSTFIKESRWKLFAKGIGNTMLITVLSIIFGTVLGFLTFWLSRTAGKTVNGIIYAFSKLVEGMPVVVLLMIMFYIVFGSSDISNIAVSVISFSIIFGSAVLGILSISVDTVSSAQREAALALGFTKTQTFIKIVLPQALRHFLPTFRSEVVSLTKATAVVGYLAVQDLTKISDIIRGATFEAFFPLIATAVIYFAIEFILVGIVKTIQINTDPARRSASKILRGINTK